MTLVGSSVTGSSGSWSPEHCPEVDLHTSFFFSFLSYAVGAKVAHFPLAVDLTQWGVGTDSRPRVIERSKLSAKTWTIMSSTNSLFRSVGDTIIPEASQIKMGSIDRVTKLARRIVARIG